MDATNLSEEEIAGLGVITLANTIENLRLKKEAIKAAAIEYIDATSGPGLPDPEEPIFVKEQDHGQTGK